MTTLSALPVPAGQAILDDLWTTPVWLGTIQPVIDHDLLRAQMLRTTHGARDIDPGDLLDVGQARAVFGTLAQTALQVGADEVRLSAQIWGADHRVPLAYGHAAWTAWCYLAVDGHAPHDRSGAVCLHDPRAGCDAASVPGLPWGRAITLKAQVGLTVLAPGWLAHSVLPVSPGHALAVLTAQASGDPVVGEPG
ncbi:2OG-Fe(II) oxygenase family protein [Streptomyces phaeochromogenes]|uniref:hypothetical protein n=1 Tax=Streptomyces phaeochromogenes TaxID=1923 RepID=UPI002E2C1398|nr:hypothetical protein [Streptomyces phaeochromogenes]